MMIRRTLRGWEKLNDWVTLLINKKNIMNVSTTTGHSRKRKKLKEKSIIMLEQIMDKRNQR
jgi:hypothetical protein